ncbi:MAG: hypothetical protein K0U98_24050 [Deltaproteobacteria bacterium]|nr:hypothetical protein [Deltaproteobacteria bacterium]
MKKGLFTLKALMVCTALTVLAMGVTTLAPNDTDAGERCRCLNFSTEVHGWGGGATCAAAEASCLSSLATMSANHCGSEAVCATSNFHWTNSCFTTSNGLKGRDCAQDVRCELCIEIPDGP